ncbi:MAG: YIP1 family protein [Terriglobia bacterium]
MGDVIVKPADADTPAQSFPERLMGIFISPGETLADVARKPDFVAPLIALVLGAIAVTETMLWKIGMERIARMSIEQSSRASSMSPEQIDQAVRQYARIGAIFAHIVAFVGVPIFLLVLAGLGLLIVNLIFGAKAKFKTVFSLICYANLVTLLKSLMALALIFFGDPDHFNSQNPVPDNVGFFLNPTQVSKPLYAVASSPDIFTIWMLILFAVGLTEGTGRKVKPLSIFLVYAGIWVIWILVKAGLSLIG